jgi:hypothetical protein
VASAAFAGLAFLVSGRALQLQRVGARLSGQQDFDALVHQLILAGSKLGGTLAPGAGSPQGAADAATAMPELQTLALQAHRLLGDDPDERSDSTPEAASDDRQRRWRWPWSTPADRPQLDWFASTVLATSFAQLWDVTRARHYWATAERLVTADPTAGPTAEIFVRRFMGAFYYSANSADDLEKARDAFGRATQVLSPDRNGADVTYDQNATTRLLQAQQEDSLGNHDLAAHWIGQAWQLASQISARWRRERQRLQLAMVVASGDPQRFVGQEPIPQEVLGQAEILRWQAMQQMPAAMQQKQWIDAFMQGIAAQQHGAGGAGSPYSPAADFNQPSSAPVGSASSADASTWPPAPGAFSAPRPTVSAWGATPPTSTPASGDPGEPPPGPPGSGPLSSLRASLLRSDEER